MDRVLVIQAARFGDLIQTKRLLMTLAQQQDAELHLAVDQGLVGLAQLLYPFAIVHGLRLHGGSPYDAMRHNEKIFAELITINFDAIYNLNFSVFTEAICRVFDPEKIIGYRPAHNSQGGLLRSPWARLAFGLGTMRSASPLNLVDFWANFAEKPVRPFGVNPEAKGGGRGLGIAVAGREERRSLTADGLAACAKALFGLMNGPEIRFFGTQHETARAHRAMRSFSAAMLDRTTDLCGKTDWRTLMDEVRGLDLLLTPDTGLMHLAACLGVPVLAFFFSSAWCHETGPYGLGHTVIQAAPPCAPCLESAPCDRNLICRQCLTPEHLPRLIAQATGHAPKSGWPENLQLWQTGLNNLGAECKLVAGVDRAADRRGQARNFVASYLGLAEPEPWAAPAWKDLLPQGQWLLPPWRYC